MVYFYPFPLLPLQSKPSSQSTKNIKKHSFLPNQISVDEFPKLSLSVVQLFLLVFPMCLGLVPALPTLRGLDPASQLPPFLKEGKVLISLSLSHSPPSHHHHTHNEDEK